MHPGLHSVSHDLFDRLLMQSRKPRICIGCPDAFPEVHEREYQQVVRKEDSTEDAGNDSGVSILLNPAEKIYAEGKTYELLPNAHSDQHLGGVGSIYRKLASQLKK